MTTINPIPKMNSNSTDHKRFPANASVMLTAEDRQANHLARIDHKTTGRLESFCGCSEEAVYLQSCRSTAPE